MRRKPAAWRRSVISLFSGAGGLDLGLEAAGFSTKLCVEIDEDACRTLRRNRPKWKLAEPGDIHKLTPMNALRQAGLRKRKVGLIAGGPPCQPFSKSGYWATGDSQRLKDPRAATLGSYLKIVEAALPAAVLLENVNGIAFSKKDEALKMLRRQVSGINKRNGTKYRLQVIRINAADYGVPQFRERIFIVAARDGRKLKLPARTHGDGAEKGVQPYLTTWDAIGDLDSAKCPKALRPCGRWAGLLPTIPEGQNYLWHTKHSGGKPLFGWRTRFWSFLLKLAKNRPSWTIQAQPGPATGPFHWSGRLLSVTELARLQTFPAGYRILGSRMAGQRQVGNAVPCAIGELLGLEIRKQLLGEDVARPLTLIPKRRRLCPEPHPAASVPKRYLKLTGDHADHPGTGLGPASIERMKVLPHMDRPVTPAVLSKLRPQARQRALA